MGIMGRVVRLGNSMAIAISKRTARERGWRLNQKVELEEVAKEKERALDRMFGSAPWAKPFVRDKRDRVF